MLAERGMVWHLKVFINKVAFEQAQRRNVTSIYRTGKAGSICELLRKSSCAESAAYQRGMHS